MTHRINARLDSELVAKVRHIQELTRQRPSEIIRESLSLYYEVVRRRGGSAKRLLRESGFVGCGEADPGLSTRYKDELLRSLGSKA